MILEEFNYIFEKNSIFENNDHYIYISIKPQYLAVLTGSIFNPIRLPMICKPKKWVYKEEILINEGNKNEESQLVLMETGGYLLDQFNELSKNDTIVRQHSSNKFESLISKNQVDSINFLNSRAFEINKEMLDLAVKEWYNKGDSFLFGGLNQLHPSTTQFDKLSSSAKKEVLSHNSKHWAYLNTINIALLMRDQTIYFPSFLDFRGRIYPTPNYLSYQSSDLARSLLLFKEIPQTNTNKEKLAEEPKILEQILEDTLYSKIKNIKNFKKESIFKDIDYFKLYFANTFGKNKLSRKGRINWIDKNIKDIINTFESDFESFINKYLLESKEPFQFLACTFAYCNFIKNNTEIKIPILFDASCSGIQHLSALTTDTTIAKLVNLLNNLEPLDFYQYCIDNLIEVIKNLPDKEETIAFKQKLLSLDLNRKWLKHPIMTIPYNVTSMGITEKIEKQFEAIYLNKLTYEKLKSFEIKLEEIKDQLNTKKSKGKTEPASAAAALLQKGCYIYIPNENILKNKGNNEIYLTQKELFLLANLIKSTVLNIIPPFNDLKLYFDNIIDIMKKLELPIDWVTPSGMTVSMSNRILKSKQIKTSLIKKSKPISILIPTDQLDYKNIKTGLMPNFIHSLDASNIHILIKNIHKLKLENLNLYTIHDCFASDYKNIAIVELLVKHSFAELYFKKNYLETVHNNFILQINGHTEIFEEKIETLRELSESNKTQTKKYILIIKNDKIKKETEKLYLPVLPDYKWEINKDKLSNEILYNLYFIS
jgi:DNA-directed RNA polymerase